MWPMSDIPAAAFWTGAAVSALGTTRRSALATGLWTAAGLLVRPNLPIMPLILLAHLVLTVAWARALDPWRDLQRRGRARRDRHRRAEHCFGTARPGTRGMARPPRSSRSSNILPESLALSRLAVAVAVAGRPVRARPAAAGLQARRVSTGGASLRGAVSPASLDLLPRLHVVRGVVVPAVPAAGDAGGARADVNRDRGARPPAAATVGPLGVAAVAILLLAFTSSSITARACSAR